MFSSVSNYLRLDQLIFGSKNLEKVLTGETRKICRRLSSAIKTLLRPTPQLIDEKWWWKNAFGHKIAPTMKIHVIIVFINYNLLITEAWELTKMPCSRFLCKKLSYGRLIASSAFLLALWKSPTQTNGERIPILRF